ncbi:conjugal transfer protein TrbD (plasmid) [Rhizobium rosettiformans]|uniref:Conjugal transfer protein TrbD n=1 Tax=Rhizobium rosettiformans TaxID=1368430 RepID=A0ABX7F466_9HYPH|nr:conjugal transfer protein TrbD [Rhizobium rosettiformans]QRF54565.1 conjugal transfer protein TrbD [Rhizobium rosettiformans]
MPAHETSLVSHPIHRALSRPNLLMGGDRELVLLTGLVCVILVFVVITITAAILGAFAWIVMVSVLRLMARKDPMMRRIYLRHIRYRPVYRATSTPFAR